MNTEAPVTISGVIVFSFSHCMKRLRHLKALKKKTLAGILQPQQRRSLEHSNLRCEKSESLDSQASYSLRREEARNTQISGARNQQALTRWI